MGIEKACFSTLILKNRLFMMELSLALKIRASVTVSHLQKFFIQKLVLCKIFVQ